MQTATSKLTKKYQATVPEPVRQMLNLKAGDAVAFDVSEDGVRIRKAQPLDLAFARSVQEILVEWSSAADEEAYRDL